MVSSYPLSPPVRKYEGANGITVLHQDNPGSRAFCIGVWINTGSRDEPKGREGLCHFLEHMIFKGTTQRSALQISQDIEKVGGSLDAFTTKEQICVYALVVDDQKDIAIDVLGDMIRNPTFPSDQIEPERQVVMEEISDVMDAPDDLIHELFASEVFAEHPLGQPILGTPESVSTFDRAKLLRFAKKNLVADNIRISIVGDLDRRRLKKIRNDAFLLPAGNVSRNRKRVKEYAPSNRLYKRSLHHQHICIGTRSGAYIDRSRYPMMVLTTLLGGGMSSRLFQRIREELGYAYSIYSYADAARDIGLMGTYFAVKPSNTGAAISEVFHEFDKIKNGSIKKSELEDTKEQLKGRILLGLETATSKMIRIARNDIYFGRQIGEEELIREIDAVGMEELLGVARESLDRRNSTVVSLGPSSAGMRSH